MESEEARENWEQFVRSQYVKFGEKKVAELKKQQRLMNTAAVVGDVIAVVAIVGATGFGVATLAAPGTVVGGGLKGGGGAIIPAAETGAVIPAGVPTVTAASESGALAGGGAGAGIAHQGAGGAGAGVIAEGVFGTTAVPAALAETVMSVETAAVVANARAGYQWFLAAAAATRQAREALPLDKAAEAFRLLVKQHNLLFFPLGR